MAGRAMHLLHVYRPGLSDLGGWVVVIESLKSSKYSGFTSSASLLCWDIVTVALMHSGLTICGCKRSLSECFVKGAPYIQRLCGSGGAPRYFGGSETPLGWSPLASSSASSNRSGSSATSCASHTSSRSEVMAGRSCLCVLSHHLSCLKGLANPQEWDMPSSATMSLSSTTVADVLPADPSYDQGR